MIEKEPKKRTHIAMMVFYFLIVFEIIYMITPFGVYYYSIYGKGLDFIGSYRLTNWLSSFFLPHVVVETQSLFLNFYLNYLRPTGWLLALLGFTIFIISTVGYNPNLSRQPHSLGYESSLPFQKLSYYH